MTFKARVERTTGLENAYCAGLQALRKADRKMIQSNDAHRLSGSVDLDGALKKIQPNAARWDYGIGWINGSQIVYWVEVHPASSGANLGEIENKLAWLMNWLSNDGHEFRDTKRNFVWISSGKSSFTRTSPQLRRLASRGLRFEGRQLRIV